ncbi:MAG: efflux RND transporter periplasmic adaptor subunit [Bacteroidales bacterium]|nr:efflux RND transporter periplasmic adaptor subunit [Bacteroidales bacterium]
MKLLKFFTLSFLAVVILNACAPKSGSQSADKNETAVDSVARTERVRITELQPRVIGKNIEYTSTLKAFEEVHLVPVSPGRIEKIFVETGDRVAKGDLLLQMDQTQLKQTLIQLKTLETDFKRYDTLMKAGSITKQVYDQAKAQYEIAQMNADFLQENAVLRAPFNGIISGKYFEDGEMYTGAPNTTAGKAAIVSLVQVNPLKAMVNIPETYFPMISNGMKAEVVSDIYPEQKYTGEIFRTYPVIDPMSHSFTIELKIYNPGEKLRPGMFCRVNLELGEVKALVVPSLAVLKMQGSNQRYVFVEKNGIAKRVLVEIGKRYDDVVEIISNELKEGDNLIISGQARLIDGVAVEIVED